MNMKKKSRFSDVAIYVITSPSGNIYVGKHICNARSWPMQGFGKMPDGYIGSGTYAKRAFQKYGSQVAWRIIFIASDDNWKEKEKRAIHLVRLIFGNMCRNIYDGGEGHTSRSAREMAKNSEISEKRSKANIRAWADPIIREKRASGIKASKSTPEAKKQISDTFKAIATEKERERRRISAKKQWSDPEQRKAKIDAITAAASTPEAKSRRSQISKKMWSDPEAIKRHKETAINSWADPQKKAERVAKCAATKAKNKERLLLQNLLSK